MGNLCFPKLMVNVVVSLPSKKWENFWGKTRCPLASKASRCFCVRDHVPDAWFCTVMIAQRSPCLLLISRWFFRAKLLILGVVFSVLGKFHVICGCVMGGCSVSMVSSGSSVAELVWVISMSAKVIQSVWMQWFMVYGDHNEFYVGFVCTVCNPVS